MTDEELLASQPRYVSALREAGVPDEKIILILRDFERTDSEIAAGRCPKCGAPIRTYDDDRGLCSWQDEDEKGRWVMYRCSTQTPPGQPSPPGACRFVLDRFERDAVN